MAALVLTIATSPALAQSEPEASETTVNEDVLVERVLWPVFLDPGRCDDVRPEEIVVTEDGVECKVTALDEAPPARVHALLIDNSGSMEPVLGRLERAAIEYVRNTPPDEPVIVTSFANNVVLEAGLSDDRERQIEAIEGLRIGHRTALLDAMYYMMRYIEHRPEPKVMIIFTDTIDNASFGRHDGGQLLSLARSVPDLSVFVVHFKVPIRQSPDASELLDRLTVETGGTYSRAKGGSLRKAFRAIRERLDNQAFISYTPPAFGQGPRDGAPEQDHPSLP